MKRPSTALHSGVFELVAPYEPAGDQPAAIDALVGGIADGRASRQARPASADSMAGSMPIALRT